MRSTLLPVLLFTLIIIVSSPVFAVDFTVDTTLGDTSLDVTGLVCTNCTPDFKHGIYAVRLVSEFGEPNEFAEGKISVFHTVNGTTTQLDCDVGYLGNFGKTKKITENDKDLVLGCQDEQGINQENVIQIKANPFLEFQVPSEIEDLPLTIYSGNSETILSVYANMPNADHVAVWRCEQGLDCSKDFPTYESGTGTQQKFFTSLPLTNVTPLNQFVEFTDTHPSTNNTFYIVAVRNSSNQDIFSQHNIIPVVGRKIFYNHVSRIETVKFSINLALDKDEGFFNRTEFETAKPALLVKYGSSGTASTAPKPVVNKTLADLVILDTVDFTLGDFQAPAVTEVEQGTVVRIRVHYNFPEEAKNNPGDLGFNWKIQDTDQGQFAANAYSAEKLGNGLRWVSDRTKTFNSVGNQIVCIYVTGKPEKEKCATLTVNPNPVETPDAGTPSGTGTPSAPVEPGVKVFVDFDSKPEHPVRAEEITLLNDAVSKVLEQGKNTDETLRKYNNREYTKENLDKAFKESGIADFETIVNNLGPDFEDIEIGGKKAIQNSGIALLKAIMINEASFEVNALNKSAYPSNPARWDYGIMQINGTNLLKLAALDSDEDLSCGLIERVQIRNTATGDLETVTKVVSGKTGTDLEACADWQNVEKNIQKGMRLFSDSFSLNWDKLDATKDCADKLDSLVAGFEDIGLTVREVFAIGAHNWGSNLIRCEIKDNGIYVHLKPDLANGDYDFIWKVSAWKTLAEDKDAVQTPEVLKPIIEDLVVDRLETNKVKIDWTLKNPPTDKDYAYTVLRCDQENITNCEQESNQIDLAGPTEVLGVNTESVTFTDPADIAAGVTVTPITNFTKYKIVFYTRPKAPTTEKYAKQNISTDWELVQEEKASITLELYEKPNWIAHLIWGDPHNFPIPVSVNKDHLVYRAIHCYPKDLPAGQNEATFCEEHKYDKKAANSTTEEETYFEDQIYDPDADHYEWEDVQEFTSEKTLFKIELINTKGTPDLADDTILADSKDYVSYVSHSLDFSVTVDELNELKALAKVRIPANLGSSVKSLKFWKCLQTSEIETFEDCTTFEADLQAIQPVHSLGNYVLNLNPSEKVLGFIVYGLNQEQELVSSSAWIEFKKETTCDTVIDCVLSGNKIIISKLFNPDAKGKLSLNIEFEASEENEIWFSWNQLVANADNYYVWACEIQTTAENLKTDSTDCQVIIQSHGLEGTQDVSGLLGELVKEDLTETQVLEKLKTEIGSFFRVTLNYSDRSIREASNIVSIEEILPDIMDYLEQEHTLTQENALGFYLDLTDAKKSKQINAQGITVLKENGAAKLIELETYTFTLTQGAVEFELTVKDSKDKKLCSYKFPPNVENMSGYRPYLCEDFGLIRLNKTSSQAVDFSFSLAGFNDFFNSQEELNEFKEKNSRTAIDSKESFPVTKIQPAEINFSGLTLNNPFYRYGVYKIAINNSNDLRIYNISGLNFLGVRQLDELDCSENDLEDLIEKPDTLVACFDHGRKILYFSFSPVSGTVGTANFKVRMAVNNKWFGTQKEISSFISSLLQNNSTNTSLSFAFPTASKTVTSCFGYRKLGDKVHDGIDFRAKTPLPVYAMEDGTVIKLKKNTDGFGNSILIQHRNGIYSAYNHLSKISVKEKQLIQKGDLIGKTGKTGAGNAPHLDVKVYAKESDAYGKDTGINPFCYFSEQKQTAMTLAGSSCKSPYYQPATECTQENKFLQADDLAKKEKITVLAAVSRKS
ncbi:MAG: peptidoglycan DD-metalloendopeptidase family protein [Candidatus Diapherotrites archaeon]|nr:peptidoglycan DD-metalloendopeptidase family protein [Candidatus Diapherotrites archaeon]